MRINQIKASIILVVIVCACDVITLNDEEQGTISFTNIYPSTPEACLQNLVGTSSKSWVIDQFTLSSIMGFQQCRLDDSIVLNDDGTFNYDAGDLLCGGEDNTQSKTGTWSINHETRTVSFQVDGYNQEELYVEMLTETEVVLSGSYFGMDVLGKFTLD